MEEGGQSISQRKPSVKRQKVGNDTYDSVTPMDCSVNDISRDVIETDFLTTDASLPEEASSSQWEQPPIEDDEYLELLCESLKRQSDVYDALRKSIIPSLALWHHMANMEFEFEGKDKDLMKTFEKELDSKDKMNVIKTLLSTKCSVDLEFYDNWSEEVEKRCGGKHISKTEGRTTIYINRKAYGGLTHDLWIGVKSSAYIWKNCGIICNLIRNNLTEKDTLDMDELRTYVREKHQIDAENLLNDFISVKYEMEPKYHKLVRQEQVGMLEYVWDCYVKREMWHYRRMDFPFCCFGYYSECIQELFTFKVSNSQCFTATKTMVDRHRDLISDHGRRQRKFIPQAWSMFLGSLETELKSETESWMKELVHNELLHKKFGQMFTQSLKELEMVRKHCINMEKFSQCMEKLFETTDSDKKLRVIVDSTMRGFDTENLEGLQASLKPIKDKWFSDTSDDYAVLGILLYKDSIDLFGDVRKEFFQMEVKETMEEKCLRLYNMWCSSFRHETVYKDIDDPARVLSWSDDDDKSELLNCKSIEELPSILKSAEDELKKLRVQDMKVA